MVNLKLVSSSILPRSPLRPPRSARSRRATPKSELTRALILEAAVDCINAHGFHGTNMARVADLAGVTRGCLQYYFTTKQDVVIALAKHVARRNWEIYESQASNPPAGRDLVEFAIDLVANPITDRYRVAHLELLTAARTTPALRPVLQEVAQIVEAQAKRFTAQLFGNGDLADTPQFRAARDLTALVNDWLFVQIFPDRRDERIAEVLSALRIALHTLWRIPSLEGEADLAKPRVRVKAGAARVPGS
ncbi:TetR/AcrR family transcriptional regulator [Phenylobacterium sp.]|uniref:TetR/AcrR family transcriptional regulator n=1 Tax=Phenylobacterium sp. TaxID=1871053 RepID=UPI00286CB553|nr:TetR/AcrR family transcriptional regulator [Phenylobacterium sp.]